MSLEYEDDSASNSSEEALTGAARERRTRERGRGRQIEYGNAGCDDTNTASDSQMSETTVGAGYDMEMSPPQSPQRTLTRTQVNIPIPSVVPVVPVVPVTVQPMHVDAVLSGRKRGADR
jgi:hypothetical protein